MLLEMYILQAIQVVQVVLLLPARIRLLMAVEPPILAMPFLRNSVHQGLYFGLLTMAVLAGIKLLELKPMLQVMYFLQEVQQAVLVWLQVEHTAFLLAGVIMTFTSQNSTVMATVSGLLI